MCEWRGHDERSEVRWREQGVDRVLVLNSVQQVTMHKQASKRVCVPAVQYCLAWFAACVSASPTH